ncbi:hypothetical protein CRYUN_Cryun27aG0009400 [Craigia yunnanensis]
MYINFLFLLVFFVPILHLILLGDTKIFLLFSHYDCVYKPFILLSVLMLIFLVRSLQGNHLSGKIPSVIGLMQALALFYLWITDSGGIKVLRLLDDIFLHPYNPLLGNMCRRLENNNLSGDVVSLINCISLTILNKCFLRQFYASDSKVDYFTYRHGFITVVGTTPLQCSSEGKSFNSFRRPLHQWWFSS